MIAKSTPPPDPVGPERLARREPSLKVPEPIDGEQGLFVVDGTWGTIYPLELAPGVRTVGELEVIAHGNAGLPLIDTRMEHFFDASSIPGAHNIPHTETEARIDELDPALKTVFFCNGPQCAATPDAIRLLLEAGFPKQSILYYRGGMHDWITLGLAVAPRGSTT